MAKYDQLPDSAALKTWRLRERASLSRDDVAEYAAAIEKAIHSANKARLARFPASNGYNAKTDSEWQTEIAAGRVERVFDKAKDEARAKYLFDQTYARRELAPSSSPPSSASSTRRRRKEAPQRERESIVHREPPRPRALPVDQATGDRAADQAKAERLARGPVLAPSACKAEPAQTRATVKSAASELRRRAKQSRVERQARMNGASSPTIAAAPELTAGDRAELALIERERERLAELGARLARCKPDPIVLAAVAHSADLAERTRTARERERLAELTARLAAARPGAAIAASSERELAAYLRERERELAAQLIERAQCAFHFNRRARNRAEEIAPAIARAVSGLCAALGI